MKIVYFTTKSGNVGRFVDKIAQFETIQIPQSSVEAKNLTVVEEFVLIIPTYLAGNPNTGNGKSVKVSPQIVQFLNNEVNRQNLRGVIGSGNKNYGQYYCKSAYIVAQKCNVPVIHTFEITGTNEDVEDVEKKVGQIAE